MRAGMDMSGSTMEDGYSALLIPRSTSPLRPPSPPPSAGPPPLPRSGFVPASAGSGLSCGSQLLLFFSDVSRALALISVLLALIVIVFIVLLAEAVHTHSQCQAEPAVSSFTPPPPPPLSLPCGVDGVDLTPLSYVDLQYSGPYWLYTLRPCSSVQSPAQCVAAFSSSQLCQTQSAQTFNVNTFSSSTGSWYRESGGAVVYSGTGGEYCADLGYRSALIRYQCDSGATQAFISSVEEVQTCSYAVTVHTTLTC